MVALGVQGAETEQSCGALLLKCFPLQILRCGRESPVGQPWTTCSLLGRGQEASICRSTQQRRENISEEDVQTQEPGEMDVSGLAALHIHPPT